jgi:murein DD-endopeptidase MepM/ murein hydrolase activator NlpD
MDCCPKTTAPASPTAARSTSTGRTDATPPKDPGRGSGAKDRPKAGAAGQAEAGAKLLTTGYASPVEHGKYEALGGPHQGTHTLGNWQSDNALDMGVPEGTPIYAVADGVVKLAGGSNDDPSSRFNGFRFTLEGDDNAWFYTHLSELDVQEGDTVKQGQLIGYSGTANGVEHLHIGQRDGDPTETID